MADTGRDGRSTARPRRTASSSGSRGAQQRPRTARKARRPTDPVRRWSSYLRRYRPGLQQDILDGLAGIYGQQHWEPRLDPTSELVLTILTQNTADVNAEKAYHALRTTYASTRPSEVHNPGIGWGGEGLPDAPPPDWSMVENAPLPELIDVIRPGGLAPQKAPRIQATLRHIREQRGDYSLAFLGSLPPLEARSWLTSIDGVGKKTASIVLLFCFGTPLMPVDRHVERVSRRIGLLPPKASADQAHDLFLGLLEPDQMYPAHVLLIHHGRAICHAQNPKHELCPVADRCRFVNPKAP